jgi:hypothetical protein
MLELSDTQRLEDAMKFALSFITKFSSLIVTVLNGFDRVIFKGHLPFWTDKQVNDFADFSLNIKRKDFLPRLERYAQQLVDHAKALADQAGRPYQFKEGKFKKEAFIKDMIYNDRLSEGLVAVLCVMETCRSLQLKHGKGRPSLAFKRRPQRVLYYYVLDREFGLMSIRLETFFPYGIQVHVNGHSWLAQQMQKKRLAYSQRDNAFTRLEDPKAAQKIADRFAKLDWIKQLGKWARMVNPLLGQKTGLGHLSYYWVIDQAEYSSDVLFADKPSLGELYPRLLDHAAVSFQARDILTFLGRKPHQNFQGEVLTSCQKQREPGARVKHQMKGNWLKMYDKFGQVLRVETVINRPREFRVFREGIRQGEAQMVWAPMNKGVKNLADYEQHAQAANERYLNALSAVDDPGPAYHKVSELTEPKVHRGRSYKGFNPASRKDRRLFEVVMSGDHLLQGFRNADIRKGLWGLRSGRADPRRQANQVTRLLKRLHVRKLIAKIPRTRRWRTTAHGQKLLATIIQLHYHGLPLAA